MWICTKDGGYINSDHVVRIDDKEHGGSILTLIDGSTAVTGLDTYKVIGGIGQTFPAHPGFELLAFRDDEGSTFTRDPIIAWRSPSDEFDSPMAITPNGSYSYVPGVGILYPDGQVLAPEEYGADRQYSDIEAWLTGERAVIAKRKTKAA